MKKHRLRDSIVVSVALVALGLGTIYADAMQGGQATLVLRPPAASLRSPSWSPQKLQQAADTVRRRLRLAGIESPSVTVDSAANALTVRIPEERSTQDLAHLLTQPGVLEFRHVSQLESEWQTRPVLVNGRETGFEQIVGRNGKPVSSSALAQMFARPPEFTGADLEPSCRAELSSNFVIVHFEFTAAQKRRFEEFTKAHIGKTLAIFVDHRLLCAPTINDAIPGVGVIQARFTVEEARTLATQLNSGALPVPLEVVRRPPGR